jgi:hypothetical protein
MIDFSHDQGKQQDTLIIGLTVCARSQELIKTKSSVIHWGLENTPNENFPFVQALQKY